VITRHPNEEVRFDCALGLEDIGSSKDVPALMEALKDKKISVRDRAVSALGRVATEKSLPALKKMAKQDPRKYVRESADDAIRRVYEENAFRKALVKISKKK